MDTRKPQDIPPTKLERTLGGRRAMVDFSIVAVVAMVTYAVAAQYDAFEALVSLVEGYEEYEIDEILTAVLVSAVALAVFAGRRIADLRNEVSQRQILLAEVEALAYFDELTGLPNRNLFVQHAQHELARAERDRSMVAVLMLDLDRFKQINDTFGHAAGDALVAQVATRINDGMRQGDIVGRFGGDEFLILAPDLDGPFKAAATARRVFELLGTPFVVDGRDIFVSTSIGIALFPDHGQDPWELIHAADMAMYGSKEKGRNRFGFFSAELGTEAELHLAIASGLRRDIERGNLQLHYQPIVDTYTGSVEAVEALLRWSSDDLGPVQPDRFIPVAEESGLIVPIGEWVLQEACQRVAEWRNTALPGLRLAVNVSSRQFRDAGFVGMVSRTLARNGLAPIDLEMEITERVLIEDQPETLEKLWSLSRMGIKLSIDDFGTGYSSLSYLKKFPISLLKIDRSFVADVTEDPEDAALIVAIVAMARSLGLDAVAEGVESPDQLAFLRDQACPYAQGYYFSRPLTPEALENLLIEQRGQKPDRLETA